MRTSLLFAFVVVALAPTFSPVQSLGVGKAKKAPVPDVAAQEQAEKLIKKLFKKEYAKEDPADLLALSAELLKQGKSTNDDPPARFVLFREAANLAARAGDPEAAFSSLAILAEEFELDTLTLHVAVLTQAVPAVKTATAHHALAEAALDLIDDAIAAENFEASLKALKAAEAAAGKAKSLSLAGRVKARGEELHAIVKEFEGVKTARAKLKDTSDDPAANLLVGKFLCLRAGDWGRGLPLLAKGADAKLKALALKDLAKPKQAVKQAEVGDGWWNLAEAEHGTTKVLLQERACHWYSRALERLTGIPKTKVQKRLESAAPRVAIGQNLLVNSSFEEGPPLNGNPFILLEKGSTAIKGWIVTRGNIDIAGAGWQAADGKRSLDMNGVVKGGIAQTFKTIKGGRYRVTFSLSGNPGLGGGEGKLVVSAAGKSAEFVFNTAGKTEQNMGWVTRTWEFTALDSQTTLEFYSLTEGVAGPALDNVAVVTLRR
jgi:choice-of-anchor C domain-containing protein